MRAENSLAMVSGRCCAINVDGGGGGGGGGKIFNLTRGAQSWTAQGQSISTGSSGGGSPSSASGPVITTKPGDTAAFARINRLDVHRDVDEGSPSNLRGEKKKSRGPRAVAGDKSGRGLRQFSMKVCEKVESKGKTTYNEVADELVAEFANPSHIESPDQMCYMQWTGNCIKQILVSMVPLYDFIAYTMVPLYDFIAYKIVVVLFLQKQFDEKNIRRRVYDALNVLMAMDIISKDKKEIQWKGLPHTSLSDIEELKAERTALRSRTEKKAAYLQELEEQFIGLRNLVQRNRQSRSIPWLALPFLLVQTRKHAHVEVEISGDTQLVHVDFNGTPFELHDDAHVLKAMGLCGTPSKDTAHEVATANGSNMLGVFQHASPPPSRSNAAGAPSSTPPIPGILKVRAKHEHL
ncbi:Transcription factor-like protein [Nymphaea thermarum]|nr:Transcription factor-like protein [Nymphaea thermarum]